MLQLIRNWLGYGEPSPPRLGNVDTVVQVGSVLRAVAEGVEFAQRFGDRGEERALALGATLHGRRSMRILVHVGYVELHPHQLGPQRLVLFHQRHVGLNLRPSRGGLVLRAPVVHAAPQLQLVVVERVKNYLHRQTLVLRSMNPRLVRQPQRVHHAAHLLPFDLIKIRMRLIHNTQNTSSFKTSGFIQ